MEGLEWSLVVILCINLMLVLGQFSAVHINPDFTGSIVDCENSPLGQFANNNCTATNQYSIDTSNTDFLPTASSSVDVDTGNVFTDIYNTIKGFFLDTLGLKYVVAIVSAPTSFLKGMGLDPDFSALLGGVWWIFNAIVIISYLKR